ncbi:hypothetical protein [Saccharothrix texasensis]|uniref:MmyB family transcriptional regulator n=1 Tax=Saccharothrix texasensis TaxID=103734 RepID=UPI001FEA2906|nr:hypothetical protein [Saccharothrix texasensis]
MAERTGGVETCPMDAKRREELAVVATCRRGTGPGTALYAGHLDPAAPDRPEHRPNLARLVFPDAHTRERYADWPAKARAAVGNPRRASGQHQDDTAPASPVGAMTVTQQASRTGQGLSAACSTAADPDLLPAEPR